MEELKGLKEPKEEKQRKKEKLIETRNNKFVIQNSYKYCNIKIVQYLYL